MLILLPLFQVLVFAGSWFGPWRDAPARQTNGRLPAPARILLSFSLLVAALYLWLGHTGIAEYSQWVALGMSASFVGDLILAKVIPFPNRLIGGMAAFAVAHGLYINAYAGLIQTISSFPPHGRWTPALALGLGFYGVLACLGWWWLIRNPQHGTAINIGSLLYGLWIGVMAAFALALGYALGGGFWLTALGGLFFVASDFIIGITAIRGLTVKNANDLIWLTYVAGQMGIIYAAAVRL